MFTTLSSENPPNTLQWDFYQTAQNKDSQIIHYYDDNAQEIWPTATGLQTKTTKVKDGHWQDAVYGEQIGIDKFSYTQLKSDHPTNGVLYMSSIKGGKLEFLRYQYMTDLSHILDNWTQRYRNDSSISDFEVNTLNLGEGFYMGDASLFLPGTKMTHTVMFDKWGLPMGVYWVDQISYDPTSATASISGRNYCGAWLNDQTMDDLLMITGTVKECALQLFAHAGITEFIVQDNLTKVETLEFDHADTVLQAFEKLIESSKSADLSGDLVLLEHESGKILFGTRQWADQYMPNSYYTFDEGADLFSRSTEKCLDGAYTRLMVFGDIKGTDPPVQHLPILVNVNNFKHWHLKPHKTKHITAPTPMTVDEFIAFANSLADAFQYVGINEDFEGPYRPQLYIGDVAEVLHEDGITGTTLGLINQITHRFAKDSGFTTEFVVDSGGVSTEGADYVVYSSSVSDNGKSRKISLVDIIKTLNR